MTDCIFCKIVAGEIPSKKVYEDEHTLAFHDIQPIAPTHVVVIPKKHIASIMEFSEEDISLVAPIFSTIKKVAGEMGLDETGFRIVNNFGEHGQQTVHHIHFHVIGGRQLQWPPG